MTAIITHGSCKGRKKYKVTDSWQMPHGLFYRLRIGGDKQLSGVMTVIYRQEQLRLCNDLQCRKRRHKAYNRKPTTRQRKGIS